ncbi:MAG: HIT family protein [Patescibacteria group bacterium]
MENCIFCKIAAGEIPAECIYQNDKVMAFLDISPVHPGHTLIIPKPHHENIIDTEDGLLCEIILTVKKLAPKIVKAVGAAGYNLCVNSGAAAGQVVFHTHFHIIPRFEGDGLHHWGKKPYKEGEMSEVAEKIRQELGK